MKEPESNPKYSSRNQDRERKVSSLPLSLESKDVPVLLLIAGVTFGGIIYIYRFGMGELCCLDFSLPFIVLIGLWFLVLVKITIHYFEGIRGRKDDGSSRRTSYKVTDALSFLLLTVSAFPGGFYSANWAAQAIDVQNWDPESPLAALPSKVWPVLALTWVAILMLIAVNYHRSLKRRIK